MKRIPSSITEEKSKGNTASVRAFYGKMSELEAYLSSQQFKEDFERAFQEKGEAAK